MKKRLLDDYENKLRTADEAVKLVKSGDLVYYSHVAMFPIILDEALAVEGWRLTGRSCE